MNTTNIHRRQFLGAGALLAAASLTPQRVRQNYEAVLEAGLDILVILVILHQLCPRYRLHYQPPHQYSVRQGVGY